MYSLQQSQSKEHNAYFYIVIGIFIDYLNFTLTIYSKVSKSIYFLRSVKNVLTPSALKSICYSIVHSHYIYGIQIWSCTSCPSNLINGLAVKQKADQNNQWWQLQSPHSNLCTIFLTMWLKNEDRRQEDHPILRNHTELFIPPSRLLSTDKNFPRSAFPIFGVLSLMPS